MRVRPNPLATEPLLDQPLRSSAGGVGAGLSGSPHYKVLGDGALLGRARRPCQSGPSGGPQLPNQQ